MDAVLVVFPGAEGVCRSCAVRFNTPACPGCGAAPSFERCDSLGRAWLRDRRRAHIESPFKAREVSPRANPPPPAPLALLGTMGVAAAANALAWMVTASPLVAVVVGAAVGVTGAVGLSLSSRGSRGSDLCALDVGGNATGSPPERTLRGVLRTPGRPRGATRWVARGAIRNVAVGDLLGPAMTLRTAVGDDYRFALDAATLVVEGPSRVRTPAQLRVGRYLHSLGWLQGSSRDTLTAIALHDGVEVEVRADFDDPSLGPLERAAFRSAPRELALRPCAGVIWVRVLEG